MKTSTMLRIYRVTCVVLVVLLALIPSIYRRHSIFATFATTVLTFVLILIAVNWISVLAFRPSSGQPRVTVPFTMTMPCRAPW